MLSYLQAILLGLFQGITELFPVSSLGHSVLLANLFGWTNLTDQQRAPGMSPFLTLLVMMHLATAVALIIFYRREWAHISKSVVRSVRTKEIAHDSYAKLGWLLIIATIPAGLAGLLFEQKIRGLFANGFFAIVFIIINGILLIRGDKVVAQSELDRPRRRRADAASIEASKTAQSISGHMSFRKAITIGCAQIAAFFPGISRSGVTMLAGLRIGLSHQNAARFSFLLATPIILLAGLYKLPTVFDGEMTAVRGPILVGSLVAGIVAYISVRFLDKYFANRSLRPFGIYCIAAGVFVLLVSIIRGAS